MVDAVGVEPTVPEAGDLQSPGVTSFPTHPLVEFSALFAYVQQLYSSLLFIA